MNSILNKKGIVSHLFEEILPPAITKPKAKIAIIGIGFELHFDWKSILKNYTIAKDILKQALPSDFFETFATEEPIQSKSEILNELRKLKKIGINGLIIYQASYMAGDMAAALARWLLENPLPVLSWSHEEITGGRLSNNRLCGQNFLLNILKSSGLKYSWLFESPHSKQIKQHLLTFAKAVYAKNTLNQGTVGMIGGHRVPGFYDCELNEIEILKRFGLHVERVDLETIWENGKKFRDNDIQKIKDELINHPYCKFNNVTEERILKSIRFSLSMADFSRSNHFLGISLKNWPEMFDRYDIAGDGAGALVQDLGIPLADESDMGAMITMVILNELSLNESIPTLADLSLISQENNRLGFWHCGGSPTKLINEKTGFEIRNHSILENYDEKSSTGMLFEFLQRPGEVTIAKYMYPDAQKILAWEGEIVPSEMAFRGSYAEILPIHHQAKDILSSILNNGCDHHWIIGRGHLLTELKEFNHWANVYHIPIEKSNTYLHGHSL